MEKLGTTRLSGHREILGLHVTSAEDGAGWLSFFRDLTARGPTGVELVTSDAHRGLVDLARVQKTSPAVNKRRSRSGEARSPHSAAEFSGACSRGQRRRGELAFMRRRSRSEQASEVPLPAPLGKAFSNTP
jgi:hypothetical protein